MRRKRIITVFFTLLIASNLFAQRGVVNNGAKIVITKSAILYIDGGTAADYTNLTAASTHGRIDLDGKIKLEGDWVNNAASGNVLINVGTDGEILFSGSSAQNIGGSAPTYFEKLTLDNSSGLSLGNDITLYGNLTLANGRITLGSDNMTLSSGSSIIGTPSSTRMVVATGTGELRKIFTGTGDFTFPVGDNTITAEYSPAYLKFTSGSFGGSAYAGVSLTDAKHPLNSSATDYLTRYWTINQSNISSFTCDVTLTYLTSDVAGTEKYLYGGQWEDPNWIKLNPVSYTTHQITGTVSHFSDFTAGENGEFSISMSISDDGITEAAENGEKIYVTLTNDEFVGTLDPDNWNVKNLPQGVTKGTVSRTSNTQASITLNGNRTKDYDTNIEDVTVQVKAAELTLSPDGLEASTGVTLVAVNDAESVAISDDGITEGSENGELITVTVNGGTFVNPIADSRFGLSNLPSGVSKGTVTRVDETHVTITLSGNRNTDYDTDITNLTLLVDDTQVDDYSGVNLTDNDGVTFVAFDESVGISHAGLAESTLDGQIIDILLSEETFADATLSPSNFTLNNVPPGVSVSGVGYTDSDEATLSLAFDGTDFDSNFESFSITVDQTELFGLEDLTSNVLTITATADVESIGMTDDGTITEGSEDGEIITVTLTGGTFADPLVTGNWTLTGLPVGVSEGIISRTDNTHATIALSGNRTTDYDSDITNLNLAIDAADINDHTGSDITTGTGVTFIAVVESSTISHAGLTEANLNGAVITLHLANETFADGTLDKNNFSLNNTPPGTSVSSVGYVDTDDATVTLAFDGTDFDINYDLSITVDATELAGAGEVTSNTLTVTATIESATATITPSSAMTESNLDGMTLTFTLSDETFADNDLDPANFTLGNEPEGTTVSGVTWDDANNATVTLAFDGTDFDNTISNFYIAVAAEEVSGTGSVASDNETITATNDPESIVMTDDGEITEGNESGDIISVTLTNGTFADPLTPASWILTNLPDGVTRGPVSRTDATHATVTLSGDRTSDYDSDITNLDLSVGEDEINDHTGSAISTNTGVTFTANDESVTISHAGLAETTLDGQVVNILLSEETFADVSLDMGNFTLNNVPPGVSVSGVSYTDADEATLTLAFDGTDFDSNFENFSITIDQMELFGLEDLTSNELTITAIDDAETIALTDNGSIIEGNEGGEVITVTLTGGTFVDPLVPANWNLTNMPDGVSYGNPVRTDASHVTITLSGDRTTDYDEDITNLTLTINDDEVIEYSGVDLYAETGVTFIANDESVIITHTLGLEESTLNGQIVGIQLSEESFADGTLDKANFTLNNVPPGVTINTVTYIDADGATLTLDFDGTDFDVNYPDFTVTISAVELEGLEDITSNALLITAVDEPGVATINDPGLTEGTLDGATLTVTLSQETFADGSLIVSNFTLYNAPVGLTIGSVDYVSDTEGTINLDFNGTDFDVNVTDLYVVISAAELSGTLDLTSNSIGITATNDDESLSMSDDGSITEGGENGEMVTVMLTGGTFAAILTPANWDISGLPAGVSIGSIVRDSDTQVSITLSGTRTVDYDADITGALLSVEAAEVNDYAGITLTSTGITFTSVVESVAISHAGLDEDNLNGAEIPLTLTNETFAYTTLTPSNFILNNSPTGTTVSSVSYTSATVASLFLAFDDTDFDSDITNFNITVLESELAGAGEVTSNNLTITAIVEPQTATISHSGLTETNLDGAIVNFTLVQETFVDGLLAGSNFTLNNEPSGTSVNTVSYVDATHASVTLAFDGTDFDTDITNFSITVSGTEVSAGSSITSDVLSITAIVETESVSISDPGLTETTLDGGVITVSLSNVEFIDATLDKANFTLNNAPAGTSISSVSYTDSLTADVTLSFDGTDFDTDVSHFSITLSASEITGSSSLTSNEITITAVVEIPALTISHAGLTEGSLDGSVIGLLLTNETFADATLDKGNFNMFNAPAGTSIDTVEYISATEATITLDYDGTDFDTDITDFSLTVSASELSGLSDLSSNDLPIIADDEAVALTISHAGLTEENLDGALISLLLTNETFDDGILDEGNFSLNNAPDGTGIGAVNYTSTTGATITLAYDGSDFDSDVAGFSVRIDESELSGTDPLTSNGLSITATVEDESVTISHDGLTEENLDGAVIEISLSNVEFADTALETGNFTLNNAPAGTTVGEVTCTDTSHAGLTISFDGTDFDTDIPDFNITISGTELSGLDDLTSNNLTITAVPTGIDPVGVFDLKIYTNRDRILIKCSDPEQLKEVAVYNVLGKELIRKKLLNTPINEVQVSLYNNYYIVRVYTLDDVYSQKVVINK